MQAKMLHCVTSQNVPKMYLVSLRWDYTVVNSLTPHSNGISLSEALFPTKLPKAVL